MIIGLDHVAIAVRDVEEAVTMYRDVLGLNPPAVPPPAGDNTVYLSTGDKVTLEIIQPSGPEDPVYKFIERRGEGLHHICLLTDDLKKEIEDLKARGAEVMPSDLGPNLAIVHPRSAKGVLIWLWQRD